MNLDVANHHIRLGRSQLLLLAAALCLVLSLVWFTLDSPAFFVHECEHVYLPSIEASYGFHGSRVPVPGSAANSEVYALVHVDPDGVLGKAGFKVGDVPVAHHDGLAAFCDAIQRSESGLTPFDVAVLNVADWPAGFRRSLTIPPFGPKASTP